MDYNSELTTIFDDFTTKMKEVVEKHRQMMTDLETKAGERIKQAHIDEERKAIIEKREAEVTKQLQEIEREKQIDRERKFILDAREKSVEEKISRVSSILGNLNS